MNILIVNHSDIRGGASIVSRRLTQALRHAGHDARMLVASIDGEGCPYILEAAPGARRKAAFLAEEAWIFAHNGFDRSRLFKADAGRFGLRLHRHPEVLRADAIILNWVNQGMLSLKGIRAIAALRKPMLWTMHDMWPFTGICHHAGECTLYRGTPPCAGPCPLTGGHGNLARDTARRKASLYADAFAPGQLTFVAVSHWLAECAARSRVLPQDARIEVIPNAFPVERFEPRPPGAEHTPGTIVLGAARLDDDIKNFPEAIKVLNGLHRSGRAPEAKALFYGELRNRSLLDGLEMPYEYLGTIALRQLPEIYAGASAVLSTSHFETLPGTLIEGQSSGAWPVSYDRGGQSDIITDATVGTLAHHGHTEALIDGLAKAIREDTPERRSHLHRHVLEHFSALAVARRYLTLLQSTD